MLPSFSPAFRDNPAHFFHTWYQDEWFKLAAQNSHIHPVTVEGSACNVMQDKPEVLNRLLRDFLKE